nr:gfo/Idh/MocA family oxidoreductase [Armatimonadota bacterium]
MSNIKPVRKVGVVGTGGMGRVHARQYAKMPDVELIAFDGDPERATAYANDTGASIAKT